MDWSPDRVPGLTAEAPLGLIKTQTPTSKLETNSRQEANARGEKPRKRMRCRKKWICDVSRYGAEHYMAALERKQSFEQNQQKCEGETAVTKMSKRVLSALDGQLTECFESFQGSACKSVENFRALFREMKQADFDTTSQSR